MLLLFPLLFFFLFLYIINLGVQQIQLLLEPNISLATFSNTLA
jgi:hypothetical protein